MMLDSLLMIDDGTTTYAGAAGTNDAQSSVDLGAAGLDVGQGQPLYGVIQIVAAPTGADTVKFEFVSDSTAAPSTDGSATVHAATGDIAIASLPVGTILVLPLGMHSPEYEQYLGALVTNVGAGALADLQFEAYITSTPHGWKAYADALPAFPA